MTFVGAFGILLSLVAFAWAGRGKDNRRLFLFAIIVLLHIAASFAYYLFVQENDADTNLYYYDYYGFYRQGFQTGTLAIIYATQSLVRLVGGTYLDYFLLFQVFGVWGIALIVLTIDEIGAALNGQWSWAIYVALFLPGTFFWTSAIGKDAPMFFACALAIWASLNIARRFPAALLGLAIMAAIRPHIALVTVMAFGLALVTGRGISARAKAFFAVAAVFGTFLLLGSVQSSLRIDVSSMASIADFVEKTAEAGSSGDTSVANMPFVAKMLSLMYRPLFVDAGGIFGLVASIHNLFFIYMTYVFIRERKRLFRMLRSSLPLRFAAFHLLAIVLLLSIMYYNVGLGLRQREMATPALLALFAAVQFIRRHKRWNDPAAA